MSVPIAENWSDLEGEIRGIEDETEIQGFSRVFISVHTVRPIEGFANLLEGMEGAEIGVLFPKECLQDHALSPGVRLTCRVRRAGVDQIFVNRERISVGEDPRA